MDPAIARKNLADARGYRGLYKAGQRRLDADRRRFLALKRHGSHQAHRQRELNVPISAFVAINEILQEERNVALL
jgi:hypothetical protein